MPYPHVGSASLRRGRCSEQGRIYLVTFTTAAREPLFGEWEPACAAVRAFTSAASWRRSRLLCWVLMPDHWHGLVELGRTDVLSSVVQRLKGQSARATNRAMSRAGRAIWSSGFRDRALRAEEDLLGTARYIVRNPIRAGLVTRSGLYPFWDAVWLGVDDMHRG